LQQQGGGDGIDRVVAVTAVTPATGHLLTLGFEGGQALVVGVYRQVVAPMQAAGELLGALAHLAGGTVHVQWQADDNGVRLPFGDQLFHLGPVRHAVLCLQGAQFAGLAGYHLADGHTDLFAAVVEAQQ